ncbi:coiled-coil domain-containing protein 171 isoform X2 [Alosa sapidissima]|uniref:coiled-coil domain-containing protein 171 isoform X2 n=1 Tax=Alosa sapidissima TaxID=34773 RepID=UPI001C098548|nr:coiled-coil domain-containing protein 171 isoform X2 [Alosa sapidissima]
MFGFSEVVVMPGEVGEKAQAGVRAKRRDPGHKAGLRASHPRSSAQLNSQEEIVRLKEVIVELECERAKVQECDRSKQACQKGARESDPTDLRWRINQLEGEKLELGSKHNQEVSQLEAQVARLRAQVERGEAVRQTLEYDIAVATRDSSSERSKAEARLSELQKENQELKDLNVELCQTAQDMQRALEISRQAREEDQQGLSAELTERDQLLLTAHAENDQLIADKNRLQAILQEQDDTLRLLKERMDAEQSERERDRRGLRQQASELSHCVEREQKHRKQLEMKLKTAEAALQAERSVQQEMTLGLQVLREKLKEAESAQTRESQRANDMHVRLVQVEKEHVSTTTELRTLLKEEKATSDRLIETIQEQQGTHTHTQEQLNAAVQRQKCLEEVYDGVLTDLVQLLQEHSQQGETNTHTTEDCKPSPSVLVDALRRTLSHYQHSLEMAQSQMQQTEERNKMLSQDISHKDEVSNTMKKASQEHAARVSELTDEVQRLRSNCTDAATAADRAQSQLQELKQHCADMQAHVHTLREQFQREEQEKLAFLHSLYQRLVAGCVLIQSPHGLLSSFSWAELCAVLQDQTDVLLTDLHAAKEQVLHLEAECERKARSLRELHEAHGGAVEGLTVQLRLREQSWLAQKEELLRQQSSLTDELHLRTQELRHEVDASKERMCAVEREKASAATRAADLRERLRASDGLSSALLRGAALLSGCLCPLLRRVRDLTRQKRVLTARLDAHTKLEREVQAILRALSSTGQEEKTHTQTCNPTPEAEARTQRRGVWGFRCAVIGVLAAQRFRALGRSSRVCFAADNPYGEGAVRVSVCEPEGRRKRKDGERGTEEWTWTQSSALKTLILTGTEDCTDMGSKFSRLLERLAADSDGCYGCYTERGSLSRQLAQGLYRLRKTQPISANQYNSKTVVSSLQQHILGFTQRLHAAEVERRNMRMELTQLRRQPLIPPPQDPKHTACVPAAHLEELLCELSAALQREQQAQELLHQQAQQLQELGLSMELHAGDQQEKDRTLTMAVKSLSECKAELHRKDQSLRQLGKHLSQARQDKQELQQSICTAENALRMAVKTKDSLASYMKSVESSLKEVKERIVLHSPTLSPRDIIWHVPNMHLEMPGPERLMGGPEVATCQGVVSSFAEVYQLLCSKLVCVERELKSRHSHISALKEELHNACLREKSPVTAVPDPPVVASGPPEEAGHYGPLPVKATSTSQKSTARPGKKLSKKHL